MKPSNQPPCAWCTPQFYFLWNTSPDMVRLRGLPLLPAPAGRASHDVPAAVMQSGAFETLSATFANFVDVNVNRVSCPDHAAPWPLLT